MYTNIRKYTIDGAYMYLLCIYVLLNKSSWGVSRITWPNCPKFFRYGVTLLFSGPSLHWSFLCCFTGRCLQWSWQNGDLFMTSKNRASNVFIQIIRCFCYFVGVHQTHDNLDFSNSSSHFLEKDMWYIYIYMFRLSLEMCHASHK